MKIIFTTSPTDNPFAHLGIGDASAAEVDAFLELAIPAIRDAVSNHVDRKVALKDSAGKVVGEVECLRA
jgi:hypothetical protein